MQIVYRKGFGSILLFLFFVQAGFSQSSQTVVRKIESLYANAITEAQTGSVDRALDMLKKITELDPSFYKAYFGMADIYSGTQQPDLEKSALKKGLSVCGDKYPKGYFYLAELEYKSSEYVEALKSMLTYNRLVDKLTEDENHLLSVYLFAANAYTHPQEFNIANAGGAINSNADEYWPSLNGEGNDLVFTRLIRSDSLGNPVNYPQEDFYRSQKGPDGKWTKARLLEGPVNTPENEGAQCISADGRLLIYTACNRAQGMGSCDLYLSVKKNGKWSDPVNLGEPVNSRFWESQPSLSSDGKWLFFVSNRPGGAGNMDIWRAERVGVTPDGFPVYGKVTNIKQINTSGNECSPFIHADGQSLYFSSDYWPGMGGKDLFMAHLDSTRIEAPKNLGYPLNTSGNEEGLIVEVSGRLAWYNSTAKGFGGRDIFTFILPDSLRPLPVSWVKGRVYDRKNGRQISSEISLSDLENEKIVQHLYPFENEGSFLFCLPSGKNYGLTLAKEGYLFRSENFNLSNRDTRMAPKYLDLPMDPLEVGHVTVLNNLFFATDSYELKEESKSQLNQMINFLSKNPGLVIEIGGHTDEQGSEAYNLNLSAKRAQEVVRYLIERGISAGRLTSKGYGFSMPVASNATEEGRARNRRTEFKILESKSSNPR